MKILVCGGAGYIGSHCVNLLNKQGYDYVVFDNLSEGHIEFVDKENFFKGDLQNVSDLRNCFAKYNGFDCVMHFSASCYVGESVSNPQKYYKNNVMGTLNLLQVMLEFGVNKFIFSSTAATFGNPEFIPIDENHSQKPINPYGMTKLMVENILKDYDTAYGLKHVVFRYFNASGASSDSSIGEWHEPETHLIPLVLQTIKGEREKITVFGTDYKTEDGTCVRDYVHVDDIAQAHILGMKYLFSQNFSNSFNLGSQNGFSVKQIIDICEKVTGEKVNLEYGSRRPGDPDILIASSKKIKELLNWNPINSDIENIIQTAWKWEKSRNN
jgi:UDP-glucose 4-epimerase